MPKLTDPIKERAVISIMVKGLLAEIFNTESKELSQKIAFISLSIFPSPKIPCKFLLNIMEMHFAQWPLPGVLSQEKSD